MRTNALIGRSADALIEARVVAVEHAARDINIYSFARLHNETLPQAGAGSHIDVHLPSGLMRQYSLIRLEAAPSKYSIAVKLDRNGRGGSRAIHEQLSVGSIIEISHPRNNFPLFEEAKHSLFIAGGIGITPILPMIQRLQEAGRAWELHYACRSRADAVFLDLLQAHQTAHVHIDDENEGRLLNIAAILAGSPRDSHVYCCGPTPMMKSFEDATRDRAQSNMHVEYFAPKDTAGRSGGYIVELGSTGQQFVIPRGKTILEVLRDAGFDLPSSCEQGICGACETKVLDGIPEHHDSILTERERQSGKSMMICCSGSKTDRLVLDL